MPFCSAVLFSFLLDAGTGINRGADAVIFLFFLLFFISHFLVVFLKHMIRGLIGLNSFFGGFRIGDLEALRDMF